MEMLIITISLLVLIWLNIVASFAIINDHTLKTFQVYAQFFIVWLVPYFGAVIVLRVAFQHDVDALPKSWIPRPFKSIVYGDTIKYKSGGANSGHHAGYSDSGSGGDGGGGGGGD